MNAVNLCSVDDLTKFLILDVHLGFNNHKIFKTNKLKDSLVNELQSIISAFLKDNDIEKAVNCILGLVLRDNLLYLYSVQYKKWLTNHMEMYLKCLSSDSKVKIVKCTRYSSDNYLGVGVIAKSNITKNEIVLHVNGMYKKISKAEEKILEDQKADFSVMYSSRKKSPVIFLGTAALINHSCEPNCAYKSLSPSQIAIIALRDVAEQEELFCYYGSDYFGINNRECECDVCNSNCISIKDKVDSHSGKSYILYYFTTFEN